ncbi:hypothetical protein GCM10023080_027000 [Streptomyces pseudoechinosporeus]
MTAASPVPVVLVGAHGYGRHHRANLMRLSQAGRVRVVGVCDPRPLDDADLGALGGPEQSSALGPLLERTSPVVTLVATPPHTHTSLALAAVRAGSHVYLEKPPTPSLAEFHELADALAESGRVCQVGFQPFGSQAVDAVRELVADGAIGELMGIGCAGAWVRDARYYARAPWAGRRRLGSGPEAQDVVDGVLTNPLAHALATALRIDGSDRVGAVDAVGLELFHANAIEADDTSCLRLHTTRGTTVTHAATLCAERNSEPYILVHGEQGRITLHYLTDRLVLERDGHSPQEHTYARTDLLENLLAHLHDGTELLSPLARSGGFTQVVEAIRTAPEPAHLPSSAWHTDHDGTAARRVIPGVTALVDRSAATLSLFSELGAPWATRKSAGGHRIRTVHIAGDSTAAAKPVSVAPMTGWGVALPFFLGPGVQVANHARDGRSSLSFLAEGRLRELAAELRPGDLLLIQFGHNDQKTEDPSRFTDPATSYPRQLLRYVRAARARGARPVLLTSVERRSFDTEGRARPTHGAYAEAVRALAASEHVPLLDLQNETLALWQRLGPEGTKEAFMRLAPGEHPHHPQGAQDDVHLRPRGAIEVARLVARGLGAVQALAPDELCRLEEDVPEDWITWPAAREKDGVSR